MFAVEWCLAKDLPVNEWGDTNHDAAKFQLRYFPNAGLALSYARRLLRKGDLAYGVARVFEERQRRSSWTGRLENIEIRDAHLSEPDEQPQWQAIPDPEDDDE
jgi:hypothetical protein